MRNTVVFAAVCSECGGRLNVEVGERRDVGRDDPPLDTGATLARMPVLSVSPCDQCVGTYTRAAKQVAAGMKALTKGATPS